MADPTPYAPSYSFSGYQAVNPTKPLPGVQVDNELATVSVSVGALIAGLGDVRRSDGALKNKVVTLDSLADDLLVPYTGGAVAAWQTPVTYASGIAAQSAAPATTVVYSGSTYVCIVDHTTNTLFDAPKWRLIAQKGDNGSGIGDLLAANNLSELTNKPQALINIGAVPAAGGAMTGALRTLDGNAAAPGVSFASDAASGLYRAGSGVGIATSGLRRIAVLDDGRLRGATDATLLWSQLGAAADIVSFLSAATGAAGLAALGGVTTTAQAAAILAAVPVGSGLIWYASTPPAGYLECNGAALSRSTYATLFSVIGTAYGSGDGSTTFNLPEGRANFLRGWDNGRGIDSGRVFGSSQTDMVGPHTHFSAVSSGVTSSVGASVIYGVQGGNTGTNTGTETRPRNIAVMFVIKYV